MSDTEQQGLGIVKVESDKLVLNRSSTLPNNRPVTPSGLEVSSFMRVAGTDRPVGVSHMKITEYIGNRPVMAGSLHITQMMSNRPVAANETDDSYVLMGYID